MADQIISTWDKSPLWGAAFTADEVNSPDFGISDFVRERSNELAAQREQYARRLLEERLPRHLSWIIDRPRALKFALRLRPSWCPTFNIVPLGGRGTIPFGMCTTAETARQMGQRWLAETKATGGHVPGSGLIFTYTDPSGLPAEVHGAN